MEVSITSISSDRFFGKAYRKSYESVEALESWLSQEVQLSKNIEIWFVDKKSNYFEIVKNGKEFIEIHLGRDLEYDYRPMAGGDIVNKIRLELVEQIPKAIGLIYKDKEAELESIKKGILHWHRS